MSALNLFRHATDVRTFAEGEIIFAAGETGDVMYIVQDGVIDIVVGERVIDTAEPGGFFGEMALVDSSPRSATARARSECRVVPLDKQRFTYLIQQTPNFALSVMRVMADRLRRQMAN